MPVSPGAGTNVLVVSHELLLRETYGMLFRLAGYIAEEAEPLFAVARLNAGGVAILVIDHTVSRDARYALVSLARLFSPKIKIISLHASAKDCGADIAMDSREGAEQILKRVEGLFSGYSSVH